MEMLSHPFWTESPVFMDLNFGLIDFNHTHVIMRILNREADTLIHKSLAFRDMIFDEKALT